MASEEDKALESLLDIQLKDQRESVSAIDEALESDPSNPELLSVREELLSAIKEAEEGLLHLKRARLLQEADIVLNNLSHDTGIEAEHLNELEPEKIEEKKDLDGSKCRFRHTDGRWYNGRIIGFEGSDTAKISFLTPTSDSMTMCKFFMQQRCRFGSSCRSSHGFDVPLSSLKNYDQTEWTQSMVGSKIWAVFGSKYDIWRKAELESWDDELQVGGVVFRDDGSSAKLGSDAMALSEYAQMTDDDGEEDEEEGSASGSEESVSSDYDEESPPQGIGFLERTNQPRGVQTDTALFAKWENHTRGIASKMMASMGYREGMGLGASSQGILDPVLVRVLPAKRSLDYALEHIKNGESKSEKPKKKRSRGGRRKREKKFAEAARAAKQEEESKPDLFSLINNQIFGKRHEEVNVIDSVKKKQHKGPGPVDRKALVAYEDEVKELKLQAMKLEEMVNRNKKDQVISEAATRRLNEVRKALANTLAAQAAASNAVESKEKEKKWLKF